VGVVTKIGVIPARLRSTRFPKKILADINGKPMVVRTAEQASKSKSLDRVLIAIDSKEAYEVLKDFNYELVMTSTKHKSGTDRIAEVVKHMKSVEIIINIQADEPFIDPALIDKLTESHLDSTVEMSTLVSTQLSVKDYDNESIVKVFLDENNFATDFKRKSMARYKHLGIYGFTKKTLLDFISFEQTVNEKNRNLEQMRAIDNGIKIKSVLTNEDSLSINTLDDLSHIYKKGNRCW
jgi:3-deoxy-manno-octulosonate cytidylyltransferase (CMP-KDO synthetase)